MRAKPRITNQTILQTSCVASPAHFRRFDADENAMVSQKPQICSQTQPKFPQSQLRSRKSRVGGRIGLPQLRLPVRRQSCPRTKVAQNKKRPEKSSRFAVDEKLLDELDAADDGEGLHLAVNSVDDTQNSHNQNAQAENTAYDAAENRADNTERAEDKRGDADANTENDVRDKENQPLICVEFRELRLTCEKRYENQNPDVRKNAVNLVI